MKANCLTNSTVIFDYRLNLVYESVNKTIQDGKFLKNQKITDQKNQKSAFLTFVSLFLHRQKENICNSNLAKNI